MSDEAEVSGLPTVSVCIPTYNSAETIVRCLNSILKQEGVDFEIVVVDDDSSDDTAVLVSGALRPGDRFLRNAHRLGLVGNHNRCIDMARGRYVQFVHADDWLLPGALYALSHELDACGGGMAWAPRKVVTEDAEWLRKYGAHYRKFWKLRRRNDGRRIATQVALLGVPDNWVGEPTCVMFRRQLAIDAGRFREDIYQLLDLDLWLRLMVRSTVCFLPREYSVRGHTADTETARNAATKRDWLDQLRVITTLVVDPAAPTVIRAISLAWWLPMWVRAMIQSVAYGPQRLLRLKAAAAAPFREFGRARSIFCG
ncbi:glycosyltransferase family 2 protein [Mycobacterium sp. URHB0021]|jgi:glycosyltransferase involved in cell wall biosynthesis